jgi:ABC-type spermidine/putrescine transport system permease subunit II
MDRVSDRLVRSLKIAATMGATAWQRVVRIALPNLLPSMVFAFVATALISLDDIVFVRYLPRTPVDTFATELFGRARYGVAPDLAAACILVAVVVLILVGSGLLASALPRIRRRFRSEPAVSVALPVSAGQLGRTV